MIAKPLQIEKFVQLFFHAGNDYMLTILKNQPYYFARTKSSLIFIIMLSYIQYIKPLELYQ